MLSLSGCRDGGPDRFDQETGIFNVIKGEANAWLTAQVACAHERRTVRVLVRAEAAQPSAMFDCSAAQLLL